MAEIAGEYVPAPLDYGFVDTAKQERGFFVTEFFDGAVDGEAWLKAHGNLDVNSGIAVGLQVAKALQLAHSKGIFHLDLKPANLLLLPTKGSPSVKVIDFGLAKVAKSLQDDVSLKQSKSGLSVLAQSVFGTFDYAPPEQQGYGGVPGAKSDVYAFGKTLYRLLTGEVPDTLHPRRLAKAPELFELLCDCVEREVDKRADLASVISRLSFWCNEPIWKTFALYGFNDQMEKANNPDETKYEIGNSENGYLVLKSTEGKAEKSLSDLSQDVQSELTFVSVKQVIQNRHAKELDNLNLSSSDKINNSLVGSDGKIDMSSIGDFSQKNLKTLLEAEIQLSNQIINAKVKQLTNYLIENGVKKAVAQDIIAKEMNAHIKDNAKPYHKVDGVPTVSISDDGVKSKAKKSLIYNSALSLSPKKLLKQARMLD